MVKNGVQNTFRKAFDEFVYKRVEAILLPTINFECYKKRSPLFCEIKKLLSEEKQYLLFDYKDIQSEYESLSTEDAYRQGLKDGLNLKDIIRDELEAG